MGLRYALFLFLALFLAADADAQNVPSYVPAAGLAAWYPFSGNALDSSGNGNNATVYGASLTTNRFGITRSAYSFNGAGNYIKIGSGSSLELRNSNYTIAAWFRSNWATSGNMMIFSRALPPYGVVPYAMYLSAGYLSLRRDMNSGSTGASYNLQGLDTNAWHFAVGVYDTTNGYNIYLDGTLVTPSNQQTGGQSYPTTSFNNFIGSLDGNQQYFKGAIDDIGVWNRVLSYCEITHLYYASSYLIAQQPANDTITAGTNAIFTISDVASYATYQWQVDNGSGFINVPTTAPYFGGSTKTLTINPANTAMNGYQFRCIRNGGACSDISGAAGLRVLSSPASVATMQGDARLTLYPNPNNGKFVLNIKGFRSADALVQVADMAGRVLLQQHCAISQGNLELDFSNALAPGSYLLKVSSGGEQKSIVFSRTK